MEFNVAQQMHELANADYRNRQSPYRSKREATRLDVLGKLTNFLLENSSGQGRKHQLLVELKNAESEHCEEQDRLHEELNNLNAQVENLRTEVTQAQERISFQQEELRTNIDNISKLRKRLNELELEYREQQRTYEGRVHQLEEELNDTTNHTQTTQRQIDTVERDLHNSREATVLAQHELSALNAEIQRLREAEDRWLADLERSAMRPVVGIEVREQKSHKVDGTTVSTLVVAALAKGGAADKAGVQVGDVITKFGKIEIAQKADFARAVFNSTIGDTVFLQVHRQGQLPNGKITNSVDHVPLVVAGARPTGIDIDTLRRADNPELFVRQSKERQSPVSDLSVGSRLTPTPQPQHVMNTTLGANRSHSSTLQPGMLAPGTLLSSGSSTSLAGLPQQGTTAGTFLHQPPLQTTTLQPSNPPGTATFSSTSSQPLLSNTTATNKPLLAGTTAFGAPYTTTTTGTTLGTATFGTPMFK